MVTIIDYALRNSKDGKPFVALILQGDIEMVQSQETGRFYATARRCSVSSSFDENSAKQFLGKSMPGKIVRKACDAYDYTIPETGEVVKMAHHWEYVPEEQVEVARTEKTRSLMLS